MGNLKCRSKTEKRHFSSVFDCDLVQKGGSFSIREYGDRKTLRQDTKACA